MKDEEVLLKSSEDKHATSWSRDGRFLLYRMVDPKTKWDFWVLPLEGDKKPVPFLVKAFRENDARFSPDGHWVAYTSDESGQYEVYVRSFSMNSAGTAVEAGGKWQISNGFGDDPRWRGDGRELYYRSRDGQVTGCRNCDQSGVPARKASTPRIFGRGVGLHSGRPPFSRGDAQDDGQGRQTGAIHSDTELAGESEQIASGTKKPSMLRRRTPLASLDKRGCV